MKELRPTKEWIPGILSILDVGISCSQSKRLATCIEEIQAEVAEVLLDNMIAKLTAVQEEM